MHEFHEMQTINIIGAGRLGQTLARLFVLHRVFEIAGVYCRTQAQAELAQTYIGQGVPCAQWQDLPGANFHLLAVPDDAILPVFQQLAQSQIFKDGDVVFHCSGSKSSLDLQVVLFESNGIRLHLASVHPLLSFAQPEIALTRFSKTICTIEGDQYATSLLEAAFQKLGARMVAVKAEHKMLYHAGAVFACNYLVSLIDTSIRAYVAAGIPADLASEMALELASGTLSNIQQLGTVAALTGPIRRADWATVESQRQCVHTWDQVRGELYRAFIEPTTQLSQASVRDSLALNYSEK